MSPTVSMPDSRIAGKVMLPTATIGCSHRHSCCRLAEPQAHWYAAEDTRAFGDSKIPMTASRRRACPGMPRNFWTAEERAEHGRELRRGETGARK